MRLVGLTGGIGSGKSSVSRLLAERGAYIIDADRITHDLERRGRPVWRDIFETFGWAVLAFDGELDRRKLGHRVFTDIQQRQRLNEIVHPAVRAEIAKRIEWAKSRGTLVTIMDVPLLIEGGLFGLVDEVWVVYADPMHQVARIQARDGVSETSAWQRIHAQMPLKDKLDYADRVIDNRGTFDDLEAVIHKLWQKVAAGE